MKVTLWGTRGSLSSPGPDTVQYGGNTSCVEVRGADGTVLVLDAGSGIRRLGSILFKSERRIDLLLTHLHMDHVQGLGFFAPFYDPEAEIHIWGPASSGESLQTRLGRCLSPPLFPLGLHELPSNPHLHEVARGDFQIGEFGISSAFICHPGPTVGYRITNSGASVAYLPDHEPALGLRQFPLSREWTSGYELASGVDLLIHDAQYASEEYESRVGWGHSSLWHTLRFAALAGVKQLVPFHHDPAHSDEFLDRMFTETIASMNPPFLVARGAEGATFELGANHEPQSTTRT
jgi:phosphoribosyl 1,2-cyclic phosphodiesterase